METADTPNAEVEKSKKVSRLHFEVKTVNTQEGTEVAPSIEATKGAHREAVRTTGEEEPTHPSPQQIEGRTENRDVGSKDTMRCLEQRKGTPTPRKKSERQWRKGMLATAHMQDRLGTVKEETVKGLATLKKLRNYLHRVK